MATQLQNYCVYASPFVALWMLLFAGLIQLGASQRHFCLYYLPVLAVGLFGIYALYTVISGAFCIDDCAEARQELQAEITETQKELKKRGIIKDE